MKAHINFKEIALLYCTIYLCTFNFWDHTFGSIFKYAFFGFVAIGMIMYMLDFFAHPQKRKSDVVLIYVWLLLEALLLLEIVPISNSDQAGFAFYEYNFYLMLIPSCIYYLKGTNFIRILHVLKCLGIILTALAAFEFVTGNYWIESDQDWWYWTVSYGSSNVYRAKVFSGSALTFGTVMSILATISFYDFTYKKNILNAAVMVINIIGIFLSSSRGPLVSFFLVAIFIYINQNGIKNIRKVITRIASVVIITLALVGVIFLLSKSNDTIAYFWYRIQSIFNWTTNDANVMRVEYWSNAFNQFFTGLNFLFGIGPASTGARAAAGWGGFVTESGIFKRFLELGFFVALLYYCFIILFLKNNLKAARRRNAATVVLCLGVFVCIMIEDTILQVTEELSVTFFLWLFLCKIRCLALESRELK